MNNILILSDNEYLISKLFYIIKENNITNAQFGFTSLNNHFTNEFISNYSLIKYNIKKDYKDIINNYNLVISLHCKQIFPSELVNTTRCINVHPGLNPFNRGWFPQVFSIINKLPVGVTIHEMDKYIDHGKIIIQKEVNVYDYDTSLTTYERILETELELLKKNIIDLIENNYNAKPMADEGNYNSINDFKEICRLDLEHVGTLREHIDLLRALSHGKYLNAYYINKNKEKVYLKLDLIKKSGND